MSFFDIIGGILELFGLFAGSDSKTEEKKDNQAFGAVFFLVLILAACILLAFDGIFAINYLVPVVVISFILSFILGLLLIRLLYKLQITEPLKLGSFIFFLLTLMILFFTLLLVANHCFKIIE